MKNINIQALIRISNLTSHKCFKKLEFIKEVRNATKKLVQL